MAFQRLLVRDTKHRQTKVRRTVRVFTLLSCLLLSITSANADDGYRLWLRYDPLPKSVSDRYAKQLSSIAVVGNSETCDAIRLELTNGLNGLLGRSPSIEMQADKGSLVIGTPSSSTFIARLPLSRELSELGPEGYVVRSIKSGQYP